MTLSVETGFLAHAREKRQAGRLGRSAVLQECRVEACRNGSAHQTSQRLRALALLLSVSAHLGACLFIATSGPKGDARATEHEATKVLSVSLRDQDDEPRSPLGVLPTSDRHFEYLLATGTGQAPADTARWASQDKAVTIIQPTGPYYFRQSELTQKPTVLHDALANLVLQVPGLPPHPVILRLLVNDEGGVDRVLVEDSYLAEGVERDVVEAFSKIRFEPGKIGRIAVRSQVRVEVRLESPMPLPPTILHADIDGNAAQMK